MKKAVNLKMIAILAVFLGAYGFSVSLKQGFLSVDKAYGGEENRIVEFPDGQRIERIIIELNKAVNQDRRKEFKIPGDIDEFANLLGRLAIQGAIGTRTPQDSLQRQPRVAAPAPAAADADKAVSEIDANGLKQDLRAYFSAFSKLETAHEAFEHKMKKYQKDLAAAEKEMKSKNVKTRQKAQDKLKKLKAVGDRLVSEHETLHQSVEAREAQLEAIQGKAPSLALHTERSQLAQIRSGLVQDEMSPGLSKAQITGMLSMLDLITASNILPGGCVVPDPSAKPADAKADAGKDEGKEYIEELIAFLKGEAAGKKSAGESFIADEYLSHLEAKNSDWEKRLAYFKSGDVFKNVKTAETIMEAFKTILKNYADEYWKTQDHLNDLDEQDQILYEAIRGTPYVELDPLDPRNPEFRAILGKRLEQFEELREDLTTLEKGFKQKQAAYKSVAQDKEASQNKKDEARQSFAEAWMKLEATRALREGLTPILAKALKDDARYQAILNASQASPDSARQPMSFEQMVGMELARDLFDDRGFFGEEPQRGPAIDFNIRVGSGQPQYDPFGGGGSWGGDSFGGWGAAPDPRAQIGLRVGGN